MKIKFGFRFTTVYLIAAIMLLSFSLSFADISSDVTLDTPALEGGYGQLDQMIESIKENYYKSVTDDQLREALYKGIFDALDPHSVYFTPKEYQAFNENIQGSFTGVGISISAKNDYIEVIAPIKGTPADKAGIKSGDIIVAVDGVSIKGWTTEKVVQAIRGEAGTAVTLTIERPNTKEPLQFKLIRAVIDLVSVEHEVLSGVDVIRITSWDHNTYMQLQPILKGKTFKNGLIIDLRNNPGGLLSQVIAISDLFLDKGKRIVTVDYASDSDDVYNANTTGLSAPMVVLVDGGSASASEIFAGAMQDHGRALIVGETTYGKGTVQGIIGLPDQGAMKLTIARYLTPSGKDIHGVGIKPNVAVENPTEAETIISKFYDLQGLSTLKRGARTMEVIGAQQRLRYLGYTLVLDGAFGPATETALKSFQKQQALPVTGFIDVPTRIALNKAATDLGTTKVVDQQMTKALSELKKLVGGK